MKHLQLKKTLACVLAVLCCTGMVTRPYKPLSAQASTIAELEAQKAENTKKIKEYIQNQLKEDEISAQIELDLRDPFTGKKY